MIYKYHGPKRTRDPIELAMKSIVVTTYSIVTSDSKYHAKKSGNPDYCAPLEQIRWWRVICNESQSMPPKFLPLVTANHRWLVSGKFGLLLRAGFHSIGPESISFFVIFRRAF